MTKKKYCLFYDKMPDNIIYYIFGLRLQFYLKKYLFCNRKSILKKIVKEIIFNDFVYLFNEKTEEINLLSEFINQKNPQNPQIIKLKEEEKIIINFFDPYVCNIIEKYLVEFTNLNYKKRMLLNDYLFLISVISIICLTIDIYYKSFIEENYIIKILVQKLIEKNYLNYIKKTNYIFKTSFAYKNIKVNLMKKYYTYLLTDRKWYNYNLKFLNIENYLSKALNLDLTTLDSNVLIPLRSQIDCIDHLKCNILLNLNFPYGDMDLNEVFEISNEDIYNNVIKNILKL